MTARAAASCLTSASVHRCSSASTCCWSLPTEFDGGQGLDSPLPKSATQANAGKITIALFVICMTSYYQPYMRNLIITEPCAANPPERAHAPALQNESAIPRAIPVERSTHGHRMTDT